LKGAVIYNSFLEPQNGEFGHSAAETAATWMKRRMKSKNGRLLYTYK
jgi:hypothetical protein